jgi:omega-6 fatty acid desaturase (delta-12 desaturase)
MTHEENGGWRKDIKPFESPRTSRSVWQIINTVVPFLASWYLAYLCMHLSYWISLPLMVIAGGFLVRIFIIFHDCCHKSFLKNKTANDIIGNITGILTFVPYLQWRHSHSVHHATNGNLDKRGVGDIWTMTVEEYRSVSRLKKLVYRLYRNPLVMFCLGPIYIFLVDYRFNRKRAGVKERMNTYMTNAVIAAIVLLLCLTIGWKSFLLIHGPIFLISGIAGIWLFYVQHQFEESYFEDDEKWDYVQAALQGSSYYKLPKILSWITGSIGFHHIHHLSPRVPNYFLESVHNTSEKLRQVETITLFSSFKTLRFRLWDEQNKKFIGFRELKKR